MNIATVKILEKCHEIEKYMARIYRLFYEEFKGYEQLGEIWRKTADEEENHALQFRMALNIKADLVESTEADLARVTNSFAAVKSFHQRIQETPLTPLEALRSAMNIERQLAEFHLDCLASFTSPSYQEMFQAMMKADKDHLETLERTYLLLFDAGMEFRRSASSE